MKRVVLLLIVLAVVTAGVLVYFRANTAAAPPEFMTVAASRGDVVETVEATGTLEAVTTVQVGTQVSGSIRTLHADFNSQVRKDQVIAELDPSLFETQVEQARATLVRLQADLDRAKVQLDDSRVKLGRAKELSARQLLPMADLESAQVTTRAAESAVKSAEAQLVQARASLNQVQVNLDHTIIRSPIDGIVVSRNVDVGQTVAASMSAPVLFILARDMTEMQVNASIDESDIGRILQGQPVTFRVDAYPGETFTGTVRQVRLQPVVQQNVVSYTTVISVPNPQLKLKPGMTATVTVEVARANDVMRVPTSALRFRPTPEILTALGQEAPPSDAGFGIRNENPATPAAPAPQAAAPGAQPPPPAAQAPAGRETAGRDANARAGANTSGAGTSEPRNPGTLEPREGGRGGRGGFGAFGDMTPEQREQMRQRMQNMSPEEREKMRQERMAQMSPEQRERMQQGGGFRGGEGVGARGSGVPRVRGSDARAGAGPGASGGARPGQVWLLADGKLKPVRVRTSISDGVNTAVLGGDLTPGATVVTGVTFASAAPTPAASGSPLIPQRGRPGGGDNRGRGR